MIHLARNKSQPLCKYRMDANQRLVGEGDLPIVDCSRCLSLHPLAVHKGGVGKNRGRFMAVCGAETPSFGDPAHTEIRNHILRGHWTGVTCPACLDVRRRHQLELSRTRIALTVKIRLAPADHNTIRITGLIAPLVAKLEADVRTLNAGNEFETETVLKLGGE